MEFLYSIPWLSVHINVVIITLALVVTADLHGLLWVLGKKATLPENRMRLLHHSIGLGLLLTMFAGVMMFISGPQYYLSLWVFRMKMLFILGLCINTFVIGKHMKITFTTPFSEISKSEKKVLILSGLVSTACWIGAYTAAQFI